MMALVASYYKLHAAGENLSARGRRNIDAADCIFAVFGSFANSYFICMVNAKSQDFEMTVQVAV